MEEKDWKAKVKAFYWLQFNNLMAPSPAGRDSVEDIQQFFVRLDTPEKEKVFDEGFFVNLDFDRRFMTDIWRSNGPLLFISTPEQQKMFETLYTSLQPEQRRLFNVYHAPPNVATVLSPCNAMTAAPLMVAPMLPPPPPPPAPKSQPPTITVTLPLPSPKKTTSPPPPPLPPTPPMKRTTPPVQRTLTTREAKREAKKKATSSFTSPGWEPVKGRWKTQPCLYYNTAEGCIHGDRCKFKHEDIDLPPLITADVVKQRQKDADKKNEATTSKQQEKYADGVSKKEEEEEKEVDEEERPKRETHEEFRQRHLKFKSWCNAQNNYDRRICGNGDRCPFVHSQAEFGYEPASGWRTTST